MKAEDFVAFLATMKWSDAEAMRQLGIGSHNTLANYKRAGGPLWLGLACAAAAEKLPPWKPDRLPVYSFKLWNDALQTYATPDLKGRPERIAMIPNAIVINDTLELVAPDTIDEDGWYRSYLAKKPA